MDMFVVRHAVAYPRDADRWPDDSRRPLTRSGERAFTREARGLKRLTKPVPLVWSSPLHRALRTAELLQDEAGWGAPRKLEALESGGRAEDVVAALGRLAPTESFAVVGHEPMLSALISLMIGGGAVELRKGGVARLTIKSIAPGGASLRWLIVPRTFRRLNR
jgi:phosphohistidine phosphatase